MDTNGSVNVDFQNGILLGLLIGEGHFGGDGKQPHVTLRMHARHEPLLNWLTEKIPGSKLYGPYHHGNRHYFQWMCRGESLKNYLVPLLIRCSFEKLDPYAHERFTNMLNNYNIVI